MKSASEMQNIIITINNNNEAQAPNNYHSKKTPSDTFKRLRKYLIFLQNPLNIIILVF